MLSSFWINVLKVTKFFRALFSGGNSEDLLLVIIKVRSVTRSLDFRDEGSFHPLLVDSDPLCAGKPLVVLDVHHPVLQVPVPFGQIHL